MASIVKFPVGLAARLSTPGQSHSPAGTQDRTAEILLFTGVFYQRMDHAADAAAFAGAARRRVRKRDEAISG